MFETEFSKFTIEQLRNLVRRLMSDMSIDDPIEAVRRVQDGEWVIDKNMNGPGLEYTSGVMTLAREEKFVAKEKFKLVKNGGIFLSLDHDFCEWFLSGEGKLENPQEVRVLRYLAIMKNLGGIELINELNREGEGRVELSLADVFEVVSRQFSGEIDVLKDSYPNSLFYVRDQKGFLRGVAVGVIPNKGVNVEAYQVAVGWGKGSFAFSEEVHNW